MSSVMNVARIRTAAVTAATKAWAVVQGVLNAVMRMNPIGLVITAITLLVGGLILAYKKSDTFRAVVDAAFKAVKTAAGIMWDGLRAAFSSISGALSGAGDKFRNFLRVAKAALSSIVSYARSVPGRISSGFSTLYGVITNPVRNAVNAVRSWLGGLLDFARSIPSRIGSSIKGAIPGFAHGGVVGQAASGGGRSGMTMVGEQGPELLSLPPGTRVRSSPDSRRMVGSGGAQGGTLLIRLDGSDLLKNLRAEIRHQGGDVQAVLGR
jgi:phage-related minor tail protein